MSRTKRGYVEVNQKKYLIYDGLNLIGRNRGATVILTNASVSQHHCAIAVIDDRHFLSDINSSNGTYLDDIKLSPLQFYELNIVNDIKIGLVNVKYFKVIDDVDTLFENGKKESTSVEDEIFQANTQICNIVGRPSTCNISTEKDNMPESEVKKAVTFNDLPTQILSYSSDEHINDCAEKEAIPSDDSKKSSINDLPTQIVGDAVDGENALEAANTSFNQSSVVIEETLVDEAIVQEATDENSNESTDFLTMQPALSQYNFNETQSQAYVDRLQRRVRNVIGSSSEDDSNSGTDCGLRAESAKHLSAESSDDETDIETSFVKRKILRKNRPVIGSDDDGDSTDAEEISKLNVTVPKEPSSWKDNAVSNSDDTDVGDQLNEIKTITDANSKIGRNREAVSSDSDTIPVTQENTNTQPNIVPHNVFQSTNLESSLADSFHLLLTNSDRIRSPEYGDHCDSNVPLQDENDRNSKCSISVIGDRSSTVEESKQLNDTQHSQSEVSFDDQNLSREKIDDSRPSNPLADLFENVQNSEVTSSVSSDDVVETSRVSDVIEDKLLEIFKPTQQVVEENVDGGMYMQPTQILPNCNSDVDKGIFDVPTQVVTVNASNTFKSRENNEVGKNDTDSNQHTFVRPTSTPKRKATRTLVNNDDDDAKCSISGVSEYEKGVTDDIFQQATQKITTDSQESHITEVDENLYLQSTQVLEVAPQNTTGSDHCTIGKQDRNVQGGRPIEKIAENSEIANSKDISTEDSEHIETNRSRGESFEEDDLFVQSTQILDVENRNITESGSQVIKISQCSPSKENAIGSDRKNIMKLTTAVTRHVAVLSVTEINHKADKTENTENAHEGVSTFADTISVNGVKSREDDIDDVVVREAPKVRGIDNLQHETRSPKKRKLGNGEEKGPEECRTSSKIQKRNFDDRENSSLKRSKRKRSSDEINETWSKTSGMQGETKAIGDATCVLRHEIAKTREDSMSNSEDEFQVTTPVKKQEKQRGTTLAIKSGSTKFTDNRRNAKLKRKSSTPKEESGGAREGNSDSKANEKRSSTKRQKDEENCATKTSNFDSDMKSVDQRRPGRELRSSAKESTTRSENSDNKSSNTSSNSSIGNITDVADSVETRKSEIVQEQTERYNANGGEKSPYIANSSGTNAQEETEIPDTNTNTEKSHFILSSNSCSSSSTSRGSSADNGEVSDVFKKAKTRKCNITNANITNGARTRKSKAIERETRQNSDMETSSSIRRIGSVASGGANSGTTKKLRGRMQKKMEKQTDEVSISEEMARDDNECALVRSDTGNVNTMNAKDKAKRTKIKNRRETKHDSGEDESPSASNGANNTVGSNYEEMSASSASCSYVADDKTRNGVQKGGQMETKNTIQKSPERSKRKLKPKIVFTMLDSPQLETIIRSLGGFVVDSVEASTVLLTASVKRSQKFLTAVAQAKPICSPEWLYRCKAANVFLDPWDYILEDVEAESKWNFSLRESLKRSSNYKLLHNYTFQIMVNTAQDVLKGSIEACGGKCVSRAPTKDRFSNFVIIASPDNRSRYVRFLKQNPRPKIVVPEAIFDGILRQELHFEDHLLS